MIVCGKTSWNLVTTLRFASSGGVGYALVQCIRTKFFLAPLMLEMSWIFWTCAMSDMPVDTTRFTSAWLLATWPSMSGLFESPEPILRKGTRNFDTRSSTEGMSIAEAVSEMSTL